MAKAVRKPHFGAGPRSHRRRDWRKSMSDNVAYALLFYTGLQIFVTIKAVKSVSNGSILPYLSLVVLVALIIPACRRFEKRWESIGEELASDPALAPQFRRDQALLWALAIGLPFVLTGFFKALVALF